MPKVGVRDLKNHLSYYLQQIRKRGETVIVTDRGGAVACLAPIRHEGTVESVLLLLEKKLAHWDGGKPRGLSNPSKTRGKLLSDIVLEEREE